MIPLFKVLMSPSAATATAEVLNSGYIGQGPKVEAFEQRLRGHLDTSRLVTVNSCTSALHLALHMVRNGVGGEVISTPLTCSATNFAILANGYRICWADVDPRTCNICLDSVKKKISPNTKAVVVVHWGGQPVDLIRLREIQDYCEEQFGHRPPVIEDCAHSWGSEYAGRPVGTFGNYAAFSFQAIKHLTTGDGGLLVCPDDGECRRAKLLRWFGLDRESSADFRCSQNVREWGFKFHMNDIAAAIGLENFGPSLDAVRVHRENAAYYDEALADCPGVTLLAPTGSSAAWIYTLRVRDRDKFKEKMATAGVAASQVHSRNDVYDCMKSFRCNLPGMDLLEKDMIAIPCGWWVTPADREYVVKIIREGW